MPLMSSRLTTAALSCRLSSGTLSTMQSPKLVKQTKQFSECWPTAVVNCAIPMRRTRAPSWAVSLYLPSGFRLGSVKILNCSSEQITTRCGGSCCFELPFSTSYGSGSGEFVPSMIATAITGARCFSCISLPNWHDTSSSERLVPDGMFKVNIYTVPLLVPVHNVAVIIWTVIRNVLPK